MKQSRFRIPSSYQSRPQPAAAWSEIDLIGKLADLKQDHYRVTLAVTTLMELLVEKGILLQEDILKKAAELDPYVTGEIYEQPASPRDEDKIEDEDEDEPW